MINTSPEIRILDDGTKGYFYSPSQLEAIRDEHIRTCAIDQLFTVYGVNPLGLSRNQGHHQNVQLQDGKVQRKGPM